MWKWNAKCESEMLNVKVEFIKWKWNLIVKAKVNSENHRYISKNIIYTFWSWKWWYISKVNIWNEIESDFWMWKYISSKVKIVAIKIKSGVVNILQKWKMKC